MRPVPWWFPVVTAALLAPAKGAAQELHLLPGIPEIETDSIADVAVAAVDQPEPAIYYNPRYARRYGPDVARFLMAHEYGHIYHHHTRIGLADLSDTARDSALQAQELEADCFAAGQAGERARAATEAAIRFFTRLGPFRFDNHHPTGAQRVSRILACLPGPRPEMVFNPGDTGLEGGPVSGEPVMARFRVSSPGISESNYGSDAELWVDGQAVGRVSNTRFPQAIAVSRFGAGLHSYRLSMTLFGVDGLLQLTPFALVSGTGHFVVRDGDAFQVSWAPGSAPALVKIEAPAE
jgi:uncharacterized protein DUF955